MRKQRSFARKSFFTSSEILSSVHDALLRRVIVFALSNQEANKERALCWFSRGHQRCPTIYYSIEARARLVKALSLDLTELEQAAFFDTDCGWIDCYGQGVSKRTLERRIKQKPHIQYVLRQCVERGISFVVPYVECPKGAKTYIPLHSYVLLNGKRCRIYSRTATEREKKKGRVLFKTALGTTQDECMIVVLQRRRHPHGRRYRAFVINKALPARSQLHLPLVRLVKRADGSGLRVTRNQWISYSENWEPFTQSR